LTEEITKIGLRFDAWHAASTFAQEAQALVAYGLRLTWRVTMHKPS